MKESAPLRASAEEVVDELNEITKSNLVDYAVVHSDFYYKVDSWFI
jgi:hypothetical protein